MKNIIKGLLLSIFAIFIFTGCGAEGELEDMGIAYTQDDYFKHGVYKKNIPVLDLFYEAGMPVETSDKDGDTALDNAIYKGHKELIKFMIEEKNAQISTKALDSYMRKYSKSKDFEDTAIYLISKGGKFTDKGSSRAITNIINDYNYKIDLATKLANNGLSKKESSYMLSKIYKHSIKNLKYIKQNSKKVTLLIETLLKNGANPKDALKDFIPYNFLGDRGTWLIGFIQPLLDNGLNINDTVVGWRQYSLLSSLSYLGLNQFNESKDILKYLLENKAEPSVKIKKGDFKNKDALYLFCIMYDPKDKKALKYSLVCRKGGYESFKLLYSNETEYLKQNKAFNLKYRQ